MPRLFVSSRARVLVHSADFQSAQHKIAEMATKIELVRLVTYKAAWNFDAGRIDPKLTSMAKWYAARAAVEADDVMDRFESMYVCLARK